jgi:hypothetical protein
MQDFLLRISLAAVLSVSGILGTYMWSRSNRVSVVTTGPKVLARIVSATNEVQRRPENRLIWQTTFTNQELYPGEAVRTASDADAQIEFVSANGPGTIVRLDPDSVIEIHESEGAINLDFLKGSIYVRSIDESQKLTVQSGDRKVEISRSEVQVVKPTTKSEIDIQVFKGNAEVHREGGAKVTETKRLKLLRPQPDQALYRRPDQAKDVVSFDWAPTESEYLVSIETGATRSKLKALDGVEPVSGAAGRLNVAMPIGKTYFRLVARSSSPGKPNLMSSISRTEVRALIPPLLLQPSANAAVKPEGQDGMVEFRWSNPGQLVDLLVEVSDKSDLKETAYSKSVASELSVELSLLKEGERYWRVSGRLPGSDKMVSSPIQKLFIQSRDKKPLLPPKLLTSRPQNKVSLLVARNEGIGLFWQPVKGAKTYQVSVESDEVDPETQRPVLFSRDTEASNVNAKNLKTGKYRWKVIANDGVGMVSPESEWSTFEVEGVPVLAWADGVIRSKMVYKSEKPNLKLAWQKGPGSPVSWRFRLKPDRAPAAEDEAKTVSVPEINMPLDAPGTYYAEVESLDAKGVVLARTQTRIQEVAQAPPLPPPDFATSMPEEIRASETGAASVKWSAVAEAKEYILLLKSADGNTVVNTVRTSRPSAEFTKLKPGSYKITLQTVDRIGRTGPESDERDLRVPEYSDVSAPKLKGVRVR